jgi:hypothetical protein
MFNTFPSDDLMSEDEYDRQLDQRNSGNPSDDENAELSE